MMCHAKKPPTTTTSVPVTNRQRAGISRCIRRPSTRSRRHSASSAMTVATIARIIAVSFKAVGLVENRVSITADRLSPGGAGPVRSVNTPTIAGRRFGSSNPVRSGLPVVSSARRTSRTCPPPTT